MVKLSAEHIVVVTFTPLNLIFEFSTLAEALVEFSMNRDLPDLGPGYDVLYLPVVRYDIPDSYESIY